MTLYLKNIINSDNVGNNSNLYRLFVIGYLLNLPLIFFTHIIDPKLWVTDQEAKAVLGSIPYKTIHGSGPERT